MIPVSAGTDHRSDVGTQRPTVIRGHRQRDPRGVGVAKDPVPAALVAASLEEFTARQLLAASHRNAAPAPESGPAFVRQHCARKHHFP